MRSPIKFLLLAVVALSVLVGAAALFIPPELKSSVFRALGVDECIGQRPGTCQSSAQRSRAVSVPVELDYQSCSSNSKDPQGLPATGICPTTLAQSGPVYVENDDTVIQDLDINSSGHEECGIHIDGRSNVTIRNVNINHAGAGICVFGSENIKIETVRIVNTISRAGPHCKPGLTVDQCKRTSRKKKPALLYNANTHNNIWIQKSDKVDIDAVYLEKGESGIFAYKTSGLTIDNIYCRDIRGPYWRGQCVQFSESDGTSINNFYAEQFLETSSGHDNFNAYKSKNSSVTNGLIDGNWSRNGVGIIADKSADNLTIKNVDIINNGTAGVSVWSGPSKEDNGTVGKNFLAENVRVRDGHCDVTWYNIPDFGPSSGGRAFAMHPAASGARFINAKFANHCRKDAVFSRGRPVVKDIAEQDFEPMAPPIDLQFPWLEKPEEL